MKGTRRSDDQARRSKGRSATLLAAVLAVLLQAFVVQTHVHAPGTLALAGHELRAERASEDSAPQVSAIDTNQRAGILCQVLAAAGVATVPNPAAIPATEDSGEPALLALSLAPRVHSHSWQSRAPPSFL